MGLTTGLAWALQLAGVHEYRYKGKVVMSTAREHVKPSLQNPTILATRLNGYHDLYAADWLFTIFKIVTNKHPVTRLSKKQICD
jgi:hypothetical protein